MDIQNIYGEYIKYLRENQDRVKVILTGASSEKWFQFELYYLLTKHLKKDEYIRNERLSFDHLILKKSKENKEKNILLTAIEMKMLHLDHRNDNSTASIQKLYEQLKKKTIKLKSEYSFIKGTKDHCKGMLLIRDCCKYCDPEKLNKHIDNQKKKLSVIKDKLRGNYKLTKKNGTKIRINSRFKFLDKETLDIGSPTIDTKVKIGSTEYYVWLWITMLRAL